LPWPSRPGILAPVQLPDLLALQRGDAAAWDAAIPWLWPAAFGAAHVTLHPYLPADVEDVAIEALEELVEKVLYDRAAGEVRVTLFGVGKPFLKIFTVERELASTPREADTFIRDQTSH
jgi:hypothetical protein